MTSSSNDLRTYSLRHRLVIVMIAVSAVLWIGMAISSYLRAHHEADEIFDAQLAEVAQSLLAVADTATPGQLLAMPAPAHHYQQKMLFQIWVTRNGHTELLVRSENAPKEPMTSALGFSEHIWNNEIWRFYSEEDDTAPTTDDHHRVYVAQNHDVRDELSEDVALRLMAPLLLGLPLLALAIWATVGAATRPLSTLAAQVRGRQPQRLDPIVSTSSLPQEVAPLVVAINDLFQRVETAIEHERHFTADAAHELRTPLAALKVQAQVAQRAADPIARAQALSQVLAGVARMTHLVEQLLTLARLDPQQPLPATEEVDMAALAAEVAAQAAPEAMAKQQTLEVQEQASCRVRGNRSLLQVLVRNLVENAIRYTPEAGRIDIEIGERSIAVTDSGPGIPEEERERVLSRFYRVADQAREAPSGAGLGLSIVNRIAELHGATLGLSEGTGGQGLKASVSFSADHF
ncbi:MAG TPA: ATP-binding protein [Rhodocyclaceae bacterium]|nr:ATP-binding protein [Rhodocyclaceae bacterium]